MNRLTRAPGLVEPPDGLAQARARAGSGRARPRWSPPRAARARWWPGRGGAGRRAPRTSGLVASSRLSTRTAGASALDVVVLDVAAVLAQVDGDAVGAGRLAQPRGLERIGLVGAACLPDGGHVIDVDVQPLRTSLLATPRPINFARSNSPNERPVINRRWCAAALLLAACGGGGGAGQVHPANTAVRSRGELHEGRGRQQSHRHGQPLGHGARARGHDPAAAGLRAADRGHAGLPQPRRLPDPVRRAGRLGDTARACRSRSGGRPAPGTCRSR